jgi:putative Holliday junction resolvase
MALPFNNVLGLDIGEKRVGVARMSAVARLPEPLGTYSADNFGNELPKLLSEHNIDYIIVGLPRNMSGDETAQSKAVRDYVELHILPATGNREVVFADETLSTVMASSNTSPDNIARFGVDSYAAVEILESYLVEVSKE